MSAFQLFRMSVVSGQQSAVIFDFSVSAFQFFSFLTSRRPPTLHIFLDTAQETFKLTHRTSDWSERCSWKRPGEQRCGGWREGARHLCRFNVDNCLVFDDCWSCGS